MKDNYPVAAARHYRDGELLEHQMRFDNAMCHYAFSSECSIKAIAEVTIGSNTKLGHQVLGVFENIHQYYSTIAVMDAHAGMMLAHKNIPAKLFDNHPVRRYGDDIPYSNTDINQAQLFSKNLLDEVLELVLDGKIKIGRE